MYPLSRISANPARVHAEPPYRGCHRLAGFHFLALALPLWAGLLAADGPADAPLPAPPELDRITPGMILRHVSFLASDELAGRDTGSHGGDVAALYIASQFRRAGLRPVAPGAEGSASYYQRFRLDTSVLKDVNFEFSTPGGERRAFRVGRDFAFFPFSGAGSVEGELIFCGYGITAPEYGYDDYAGRDVRGQVVLVLRHEPLEGTDGEFFAGKRHSPHATFLKKFQNAMSRGAAALVLVNDPLHCAAKGHVGSARRRSIRGLHAPGRAAPKLSGVPAVFAGKEVATYLEEKLRLRSLQAEIDASKKPRSTSTGLRVKLSLVRENETLTVSNVAGILPGSDPALREEFVVVGAHFDHEGVRGEEVMNGANDNASGTTAVILLAEALAAQPRRPRRSILFLAFNAEEKGLLGSRHYVEKPLVPLEKTVCMINMDMIGRSKGNSVEVIGGYHSPLLDRISRRALETAGITEPKFSGPRVNARSDHFPFFRRKVPILVFHSDDEGDYHQPTDDVHKLTMDVMERIIRAVGVTVWMAANHPERPRLLRRARL